MSQLTKKPNSTIQQNAQKGLDLHYEFNRGGTEVGLKRAKDLIEGKELTEEDIKKMYSYFARHEVDKKAKGFDDDENPSAGYIAWLLWGGDEAKEWIDKLHQHLL